MPKIVAILEDDSERLDHMRSCLRDLMPDFEHIYFDDAEIMIRWLEGHLQDVVLISLDHDLPIDPDHGTGRAVADWLSARSPICPVIVHTSNEFFAPGMMAVLQGKHWPVVRVYPHTDHNWVRRGWAQKIRQLEQGGWIF